MGQWVRKIQGRSFRNETDSAGIGREAANLDNDEDGEEHEEEEGGPKACERAQCLGGIQEKGVKRRHHVVVQHSAAGGGARVKLLSFRCRRPWESVYPLLVPVP